MRLCVPAVLAQRLPVSVSVISKRTVLPIFHIQFEAIPSPESDDFDGCGGAFVNCWIRTDSEASAVEHASQAIRENRWTVVSVSEECGEVMETDYVSDESGMEYFRSAVRDGNCCVYHQWPNEPQEEDHVH